jgi:hypothetical protein
LGIVAKRKADPYRFETVWYKIKSRAYTQGKGDGSCSRDVVTYESAAWLDMPGKARDVETASLEFKTQSRAHLSPSYPRR